MRTRVDSFIRKYHLLQPNLPVAVALSGGPDSVALLHILQSLNYPLLALHCNFHLRGEESLRDQNFVLQLCKELKVKLLVTHFDTRREAHKKGISIEMAARDLRYQWFHQQVQDHGAQAIAVGHHSDDQAETLLINLLRGTGIRGMAGMHPKQGIVVRPLLGLSRADIMNYLTQHHLQYVTDSSNLEPDVLRNRIRLQVMPLLRDIQHSAASSLAQAAQHIGEALPYYKKGVNEAMKQTGISDSQMHIPTFMQCGAPHIMLHEWLFPLGFNNAQIWDIHNHLYGNPGRIWESSTHRVLRDRTMLFLSPKVSSCSPPQYIAKEVNQMGPTGPNIAYFDADLINQPLTLRLVAQGDWFVPFGMTGRKLVSDFLTDRKLSRFQKEHQWLLCMGTDILWVVGQRSDNRYRITEKTKHILQISIQETIL